MQSTTICGGLSSLPPQRHAALRSGRPAFPCDLSIRGRPCLRRRVEICASEDTQDGARRDEPSFGSAGLAALWQHITRGVALLPLVGVALLAPSAAHAAWRHANAPVPEAISVGMVSNEELTGLHEARGFQYPLWQRLQWLGAPEEGGIDEEVIADGPEWGMPRAVQDVVSPAWHRVQWLLQQDEKQSELARTRFFAAVTGSAVLLALLLRFAVSLADQNTLTQQVPRFQSSPGGGGFSGGGPNPSGGGGSNPSGGGGRGASGSGSSSGSQASAGGTGQGASEGGAAAASAAAAVLMQGGLNRGVEPRNRNRFGPYTSGGSIGGSDLNGGFSVTSFVDGPTQPQMVPRPWVDQSNGNRRVVSHPPINRKPRFVKSPPVQPTQLKKKQGPSDANKKQASLPRSSKKDEIPRNGPFQQLSSGRASSSLSDSIKSKKEAQNARFQPLVPRKTEKGAVAPGASVSSSALEGPSAPLPGKAAKAKAVPDLIVTANRDSPVKTPLEDNTSNTAPQAAPNSTEELDIAEIGALAAEVASSGGVSIFGDSDSLSDLAKEVAGTSGNSALALDPAAKPSTAREGTSMIKTKSASGISGPNSGTLPLAASVKPSFWDSLWAGGPKRDASDQGTAGKLMAPDVLALPRQLTMGMFSGAFGAFSRSKQGREAADIGRTMVVGRRGQSLIASSHAPAGPAKAPRGNGLTMAERAELAFKQRRPWSGAKVSKPRQGRWAGMEKYDLFQEALESSAAANKDAKFGPLRSVLAAIPPSGAARYDMVGSLLRGAINSNSSSRSPVTGLRSKYDVVWQLLASGRSSGATSKPRFDPVYDLMGAAAMAADWGHSTVQPLGGWGLDIYDPLQYFGDIRAPTVRSKYDPLQAVLAAEAPTGSNKYDMVGETLAAGLAAEMTPPSGGPVVGVFDWMRSVVGAEPGPTEVSRYDPMTHLLAADIPHAPSGDYKYDAFAWLRNVPFNRRASPTGTTVLKGGRAQLAYQAPGKYDPASPLLGWLSEPVPTADDPLRAFIRRVAQGPQNSSDMAIRPAFVYNDSSTGAPVAVPVDYPGEEYGTSGRNRWPFGARFGRRGAGGSSDSASDAVESPFDAQLAASTSSSLTQPRPAATAASHFDAVPDLLKLWNALAASSAQLDPLDAVNVIANRGAGASFFGVAQAFRRLVDDRTVGFRCGAVWDLAKTTQGRTSLPPVTVEAARAGDILVRQLQGNSAYEPLAALLKGRPSKEVVAVVCVLYDLLLSPARPLPQLQPYAQAVGQTA